MVKSLVCTVGPLGVQSFPCIYMGVGYNVFMGAAQYIYGHGRQTHRMYLYDVYWGVREG